jgi:hypothetical protein
VELVDEVGCTSLHTYRQMDASLLRLVCCLLLYCVKEMCLVLHVRTDIYCVVSLMAPHNLCITLCFLVAPALKCCD